MRVTGGKGTIEVSFNGKTYYVCCSAATRSARTRRIIKEAEERRGNGEKSRSRLGER